MIDKQPSLGVVGGGYWGKNLVRVFSELGILKAICDSDAAKRDDYTNHYPGIAVYEHYEAMLQEEKLQGVVIAAPAIEHYRMTRLALEAGRDVLVEKPLALQMEQGEELANLAKRKGLVLMVGHILEYHPAVRELVRLIKKGELGEIRYIYSNRLNLGRFRTEENILWSFAPHDIAVIIRLLDEVPAAVSAVGRAYLNRGIADVTVTNLFFKGEVGAHIFVSWLNPFKEQKLVVVGAEKMALFDDLAADKLLLFHHRVDLSGLHPVAQRAEAQKITIDSDEPLKLEGRHFLECIEKRAEPLTGPRSGLNVLRVLTAAQQSLDQKGQIVSLHEL